MLSFAGIMRAFCAALFCSLAVVISAGCARTGFVRVSDGVEIDSKELVEKLKSTRAIFVGEYHDERSSHDAELKLIKALREAKVDFAVGLEMFMAENQSNLDAWISGRVSEAGFRHIYSDNWRVPWDQYRKIFMYAKDHKVPLVGLNVSKKIVHQVFKSGIKSLSEDQLKDLPGISCDVHPNYAALIKKSMKHHKMEGADYQNYCEAQMVWDITMAMNAVKYMQANPEKLLVVIAGGGHSWKHGIPAQVARLSNLPYLVVIPGKAKGEDLEDITFGDADYIWVER